MQQPTVEAHNSVTVGVAHEATCLSLAAMDTVPFKQKEVWHMLDSTNAAIEAVQEVLLLIYTALFVLFCYVVFFHSPASMGAFRGYLIWASGVSRCCRCRERFRSSSIVTP